MERGSRVRADPQISVVIPVWRSSESAPCWIEEAIDSVRAQTFAQWELIVVDDGSPAPIAPARRDDLVLVRQPNTGPGGARNVGVALARGHFVAFLDADDRYTPRKLELQSALHARRPELVLSATDYSQFDERGTRDDIPPWRMRRLGGEITLEQLFFENCIACSTTMMPRAAFVAASGMSTQRRLGEDYGLWLRLARAGAIGYLDEPLLERRRHPDNLTTQYARDGVCLEHEREVYEEFLAEHPELRGAPFVSGALARIDHEQAWIRMQRGDWREARRYLIAALRRDPTRAKAWKDFARTLLRR